MIIIKRDGSEEAVNLNKITNRISQLTNLKPSLDLDPIALASKVTIGLYDGISSKDVDSLAMETAAYMSSQHPDYDSLAARLLVSNLHKEIAKPFSEVTKELNKLGILDKEYYKYVIDNSEALDKIKRQSNDFNFSYFALKTLTKSYLLKDKKSKLIETPQDMYLRVATFINQGNLSEIKETYQSLSNGEYIHATPTLFNAGCKKPQLSSCFLLDISDDSIEGIYKTLSDCAKISQSAGGIGLSVNKIRASGSYIAGTNGHSNGLVPMLRVFDATARYVDQGGGKRKGSIAVYLEPWHKDIESFLDLKKNHGKEELRARDLFYAMWIPDIFMRRVRDDGNWTLFDPKVTPELSRNYGVDFDRWYETYEQLPEMGKTVKARDIWNSILTSQIETGTPYMLYKDAANEKSNQKNLGIIKSSNLCCEILEYTSKDEIAVCNLASLSLPKYVVDGKFDFEYLYKVTRLVTRNLNKVIDRNFYPVPEAKASNIKHRPLGIGVQGLADVFALLKMPFTSLEAKDLNRRIFETLYRAAIDESIDQARLHGAYQTYEGSPASFGQLQFDLWGVDQSTLSPEWKTTIDNLSEHGLRNSLLIAPMPTASTSQILGNNECFEPFTTNLYVRRTLAGEFILLNKYLVRELIDAKLWTPELRNKLTANQGSVQNITEIPAEIRERYKTVWEMKMKDILDMAADRAPFVCQTQSMNLFMVDPSIAKVSSMHFYAWGLGLKTGMYYLRSNAASKAIQFTVTKTKPTTEEIIAASCSIDDPDCLTCSA